MAEYTGEKVIRVVKRSRRAMLFPYLLVIVLFFLAFYSWFVLGAEGNLGTLGTFFIIAALFILSYSEFRIRYKKLIVSNKKVVLQEGTFQRSSVTINYSNISEVIAKQNFIQRLLVYGDILIRTSSTQEEHELSIDKVSNPFRVKKIIEHFMFRGHKI